MNKHAQPVYKQGGWDDGGNQYQNGEHLEDYAQFTNNAYSVKQIGDDLDNIGAFGDSKEYNMRDQDFENGNSNYQVTHSKGA